MVRRDIRVRSARRVGELIAVAGLSLAIAAPAPASVKPCRDKDGRIIACSKPARTSSPRCKDANGRFVACPPVAGAAAKPS